MIKAILLDLDQTLLYNPTTRFVQGYMQRLINHFAQTFPRLEARHIQAAMLSATQQVISNHDPLKTNQVVFNDHFMALAGLEPEEIRSVVIEFLDNGYPHLQTLTAPLETAPRLVKWLMEQGYAVALATNPLFPRQATLQRLRWAGLEPDHFWFISTLDNTHFTKPTSHYYEEVLTRIGFEPDETLMVGDDWDNDIVPAWQAGLNTFWINDTAPTMAADMQPDGQGTLDTFMQMVTEQGWLESLQPRPVRPEQIEPRLVGNVGALLGMVSEVPADHFWEQHPDPNEWSPLEVVVHIRNSERTVQRPRLQTILREDNPFLAAPQTPPLPGQLKVDDTDGMTAAREFAVEREQTVALLRNLSREDWLRPARHSVFGPTNLLEMAAFTARHDRLHINQLCQTIGKCE